MSLKIRKLCPELAVTANNELNETPQRLQDDLDLIRDWLRKQRHLKARTDDQFLIAFLRGCKFSLARAKDKLDMYYTMRTLLPEFYSDRDPMQPELQKLLDLGIFLPLPNTEDPASPRVLLLRTARHNPDTEIIDAFKINGMLQDILLMEDDNYIIAGGYIVQDLAEMSLTYSKKITPSIMKKAITCFEKANPVRPKGLFLINGPSFFQVMYNVVRSFMSEKFKSRMNVVGRNYDVMYKTIPKRLLPNEYGGEAGTLQELTVYWKKKVESYRDFFLEDGVYRSDESKRSGLPKTTDEMFGIVGTEGSFRKLDID